MQYMHNLNECYKYNLPGYNLFPIVKVLQGNVLSSSFLIQPGRFVVIPSMPDFINMAASPGSSIVQM